VNELIINVIQTLLVVYLLFGLIGVFVAKIQGDNIVESIIIQLKVVTMICFILFPICAGVVFVIAEVIWK